ncbi:transcriptional regulator [Marinobacterium nitratireducens]|uniref:Transcriptional regulator n=1 Tax=Marinobacterium nitratireducens TaxID=518897 RepID=A0A917Z9T4_9GAMM|nr:helix-turn-helix domain-containing protein [Marinobacterium nitratireducens]GGO79135.1 transcriptional regulator [Marinobacterium nitratireducens]
MATNVVCKTMHLLDLLREQGALGLEELHILTEMPKATVKRLMDDLVELEWVHRRLGDRRYALLKGGEDVAAGHRARLASRLAPLLIELYEETGFSSDVALDLGDGLEVVESNFALLGRRTAVSSLIGLRPHVRVSAIGRAFAVGGPIAQELPSAERKVLLQEKQRGFCRRVQGVWEHSFARPFEIGAVAMPVGCGGVIAGAVNLYWDAQQYGDAGSHDRHLARLETAVARIGSMLSGA